MLFNLHDRLLVKGNCDVTSIRHQNLAGGVFRGSHKPAHPSCICSAGLQRLGLPFPGPQHSEEASLLSTVRKRS